MVEQLTFRVASSYFLFQKRICMHMKLNKVITLEEEISMYYEAMCLLNN